MASFTDIAGFVAFLIMAACVFAGPQIGTRDDIHNLNCGVMYPGMVWEKHKPIFSYLCH